MRYGILLPLLVLFGLAREGPAQEKTEWPPMVTYGTAHPDSAHRATHRHIEFVAFSGTSFEWVDLYPHGTAADTMYRFYDVGAVLQVVSKIDTTLKKIQYPAHIDTMESLKAQVMKHGIRKTYRLNLVD